MKKQIQIYRQIKIKKRKLIDNKCFVNFAKYLRILEKIQKRKTNMKTKTPIERTPTIFVTM